MKRHPALEPFSRDHNDGLILARYLVEGREGSVEKAISDWDCHLRDHFEEEERLLTPLLPSAQADRLRDEHRAIGEVMANLTQENAAELGDLLERHIRWEEREMFPLIESTASEEDLRNLAVAAWEMEEHRWPNDPNRQKLVLRRMDKLREDR